MIFHRALILITYVIMKHVNPSIKTPRFSGYLSMPVMQLLRIDGQNQNQKQKPESGPLRLPARVAVRSSSPTPPGIRCAAASLRRTPAGFGPCG